MIRTLLSSGNKTVAGVLSAFNKTLDDLKAVEVSNEAEAVRQAQIIIEAQASHDSAIQEAAMSREVQAKLTAIIVPTLPTLGTTGLGCAR